MHTRSMTPGTSRVRTSAVSDPASAGRGPIPSPSPRPRPSPSSSPSPGLTKPRGAAPARAPGGVAGSRKVPVMSVLRSTPFEGMRPRFHHTCPPRRGLPTSRSSHIDSSGRTPAREHSYRGSGTGGRAPRARDAAKDLHSCFGSMWDHLARAVTEAKTLVFESKNVILKTGVLGGTGWSGKHNSYLRLRRNLPEVKLLRVCRSSRCAARRVQPVQKALSVQIAQIAQRALGAQRDRHACLRTCLSHVIAYRQK